MQNICVFLSGYVDVPKYADPAREFARLMVRYGYGLTWGGTNQGLMGIVCTEVKQAGGRVCGVIAASFEDRRMLDADEMIVVPDLAARKRLLCQRSDAFVVMAGGTGTLDEATEVLELKKRGAHSDPIVFLNTGDFFGGLHAQLARMEAEGFLPKPLADLAAFAATPAEAIAVINEQLNGNP